MLREWSCSALLGPEGRAARTALQCEGLEQASEGALHPPVTAPSRCGDCVGSVVDAAVAARSSDASRSADAATEPLRVAVGGRWRIRLRGEESAVRESRPALRWRVLVGFGMPSGRAAEEEAHTDAARCRDRHRWSYEEGAG